MMKFFLTLFAYVHRYYTSRHQVTLMLRLLVVFGVLIVIYSVLFQVFMAREGRNYSWITGVYWTLTVMSTLGLGDIDTEKYIVGNAAEWEALNQAGIMRSATYNTPIQTNASYPIIGLTALLTLVKVVDKVMSQTVEETGTVCQLPSSPPPRSRRDIPHLWGRLPAANHHRLMWLLSQLLEHQLKVSAAKREDGHESPSGQ